MSFNLQAAKRVLEGSAFTFGDPDWAGHADRFTVSGTASWVKGRLGGCPITATSKEQPTIAHSSVEAEFVAALSGAFECTGPRQQWNWLRKSGHDSGIRFEMGRNSIINDENPI